VPPVIADYEVLQPLGAGTGPAAAYLVRPPARLPLADGATVVAHLVPLPDSVAWPRLLARLSTAAAAAAGPGLAPVLEAVRYAGRTSWVTASHATDSLERDASLSRRQHVQAVVAACRGAHLLHEAGLAHGAIRPSTIWVGSDGAALGPAAAWALDDGVVWPGGAAADLTYVDPDLLRGAPPSRASDVWALGAVLHRALSAQDLYDDSGGSASPAVVQQHRDTPPRIDPLLRPELAEVLSACLAADPAERPPSAAALADRIEAAAEEWA
jgi:hypothetical protein